MTASTLILISSIVSAVCVILAIFFWSWRIRRRGERAPVAEKLLRSAGESLRLKIEQIEESLSIAVFLALGVPTVALAFVLLLRNNNTLLFVGLLVCLLLMIFLMRRVFKIGDDLRNYRLGFRGERAVGEELNQLLREGCHVFHDVPMEPYGNIDHVIVAPSGIFAVETKTYRKRKAPVGRKEHEIIYDGKTLDFPNFKNTQDLEQAQQQADRLRNLLSKAVGEPVPVSAILTFPGWFVTSRVNTPGLKVVNPKQIKGVVMNGRNAPLNSQFLQRIVHQLDQKCRDVEF